LCLALSGCYVKAYGLQSTGGGTTSTTTSTQVAGTVKTSAGRAAFSSGQAVSPAAPGGHVALGRGGTAIVAVGLIFVDAVRSLGAWLGPDLQPAAPGYSIADTCSCYQKQVMGDE
jgi:hypothetical protein